MTAADACATASERGSAGCRASPPASSGGCCRPTMAASSEGSTQSNSSKNTSTYAVQQKDLRARGLRYAACERDLLVEHQSMADWDLFGVIPGKEQTCADARIGAPVT